MKKLLLLVILLISTPCYAQYSYNNPQYPQSTGGFGVFQKALNFVSGVYAAPSGTPGWITGMQNMQNPGSARYYQQYQMMQPQRQYNPIPINTGHTCFTNTIGGTPYVNCN